MRRHNLSLAKELRKSLKSLIIEEIEQCFEEGRINKEKEILWAQRKYELSNSFGEKLISFDDKLDGFYFPEGLMYEEDQFGCLVPVSMKDEGFAIQNFFIKQYPWLFDESSRNVHTPDDLQNTRGYNRAFVFAE